ncbi:type I glyceraldehyde-3-phosphate dehydrogenase [Alkalibacter mobilis]|uniref:type I glyceraldehyde-3-phosphate dehydrogenase n=1 Tax=Alkalibacter mobilis TaxID=2787712 RepID=UPI0018A038C6|nr:glyceraldehyde 3-phosphate dehydrogenase NAD-binding domain-containing protein [Alkalibacter mobilis]MBF7095639.1 glyceraldehyde-3-phosphate dehydrogenase [Alkalibacter mobilis]
MDLNLQNKRILGINGLGRIGKLTLWHHLNEGHFDRVVMNAGRQIGKGVEDAIHYLTTDSTYGTLDKFLYGYSGKKCSVRIIDRQESLFEIEGLPVKILTRERNPKDINWKTENAHIVIDCTGKFLDPTLPADHPGGSVRGHLEAGAEKVIVSAPFKISNSSTKLPEDCSTFVYGVNHTEYDPYKHHIISAASCTTTGLAHMMKPLVNTMETAKILTASMTTVHAATNNQNILDAPPKTGSKDLRKNRSALNNMIPTTTGAAIALEEIIPEVKSIGFMADSIRIPTNTVSLISLNLTFLTEKDEKGNPIITQNFINQIYKTAAEGDQKDLLLFSENQNVSGDLMGTRAAVVIEGLETHTRTGFLNLDEEDLTLPLTHAKIFGWYDNEYGCYVNALGKLTKFVDKNLI